MKCENKEEKQEMKHYIDIEYENGDVCKFILPTVEALNKTKLPVKNCWCGLDICEDHIWKIHHSGGKDRGTIYLHNEADANKVIKELEDKDAKDPEGEGWKISLWIYSNQPKYQVVVEKADLEERRREAVYQREKEYSKKLREWANS